MRSAWRRSEKCLWGTNDMAETKEKDEVAPGVERDLMHSSVLACSMSGHGGSCVVVRRGWGPCHCPCHNGAPRYETTR